MTLEPFRPEHLLALKLQPAQEYLRSLYDPSNLDWVAAHPSFSGVVDGEIIGCGGILPLWDNRASAWMWLGAQARRHMLSTTRAVLRFLEVQPYRRVEISVDREFGEAHRWARMLGFQLEAGRMRAYRPDGGDCSLYARVRS